MLCSVISTDKRNQTFEYILNTFLVCVCQVDLFAPVGVAFPQNCLATSSRSVLSCLGQSQRATLALTVAATIGGSQIDDISIRVLGSQTLRLRGNRRVLVSLLWSEVMTFENCKIYSHALLRGRTQQALTQMSGFSSARCCRLPLVGVAVWHGVQ